MTIELGFMAIVIGLLIALPVGIYSAIRQDTAADWARHAIIGLATPNFWPALMVMIFPAIWWGWSPPMKLVSFMEDPLRNLGVFIIPSVIPGTALSAATMRMTRTMMLEAPAGLYPHRLFQGDPGSGRDYPTHYQKCPHPGYHPDWHAVTFAGRRRHYHGEHIQPAGARSSYGECTRGKRLPGGLRGKPDFRHRGFSNKSNDRPDLSLFGPQGAV